MIGRWMDEQMAVCIDIETSEYPFFAYTDTIWNIKINTCSIHMYISFEKNIYIYIGYRYQNHTMQINMYV